MGRRSHLPLASTRLPNSANPQKDVAAQRHRGLGHDAQNGLAEVLTASALSWPQLNLPTVSPIVRVNQ